MAVKIRARSQWWEFRPILMAREPFDAGNLRGMACNSDYVRNHRGHLPDQLGRPMPIPGSIDYAVYSYQTPIAWHLAATDEWVVPNIRYSVTTSQHQHRIGTALSITDERLAAARAILNLT